jgi:hypothetical protein
MKKDFEMAITASVGEFLKQVRNGNKPSMANLLKKNGVNSPSRARQLVDRMLANDILIKHRDGSYSLTHGSFDYKVIMPILLKREYHRKEVVVEEVVSPFAQYTSAELVAELRARGYKVSAVKEIVTVETL